MDEQKIKEAFDKHCNGDEQYFDEVSFTAGYLALLNELEPMYFVESRIVTYALPEGIEK